MNEAPFVRVLGSADWLPTRDNDGSCYTLGDKILIDTGWSAITNLINRNIEPLGMSTVLFTHMHADHYMALPQLILYWRIRRQSLGELTIAGPAETIQKAFDDAFHYVFHDSEDVGAEVREMPRIVPLKDGSALETEDFSILACDSLHAAPGVCYRVTHKASGHTVGFTGDTAYREVYGAFFRDCDLLVHEASFGATPVTPETNRVCKHSSAHDAIRVAKEANVRALLLTHCKPSTRDAALAAAKAALDIPVHWATPWQTFAY